MCNKYNEPDRDIMAKISQSITPQELLQGLQQLKKEGVELPSSPEALLNQIVNNTAKVYMAKVAKMKTQPLNGREAKLEADSTVLRKNMIAAKRYPPEDTDAHHIVPGRDNRIWAKEYAEAARAILRRWGIPINHEVNGVFLPRSSTVPVEVLPHAYPHKKVHTKFYYITIATHLGRARSCQQCIEILQEVGEDLEDGIYPIRKGQG